MDFSMYYTEEQEDFRQEVREWMDVNIPSDFKLPINRYMLTEEQCKFCREFKRKWGEKGWQAPMWPKEYGGGGLSEAETIIIHEEINRRELNRSWPRVSDQGLIRGAATVMTWGTEEQKQRFARPVFEGRVNWWQLWTEPDAGSDLAGVKATAYWDGEAYVLNGHKIFMSGTGVPDLLYILVKTDPEGARHRNLGAFIIPPELPGITINHLGIIPYVGRREVYFDNVRVSHEYRIGGETQGWQVTQSALEIEHGGGGVEIYPRDLTLLEKFTEYCRETMRNGQPLINDPYVQERLVELYINYKIESLFMRRNFWAAMVGMRLRHEGPETSLHGKLGTLKVAKAISDIVGPYAFTNDPRWSIADMEVEGQQTMSIDMCAAATIEIQKVIMARRMGISKTREEAAVVRSR
ncbi:acyl-CoA dehydrogenase family protein [Chloroflexota bacterium]